MIRLYSTPSDPQAWHQVRAPGGYEVWYFDAEDSNNDRRLVVAFFDGLYTHPGYLHQYARYRRSPTRHAPPVPGDYPGVFFALYERSKARWRFSGAFEPGSFRGQAERLDVSIGPNRLWQDGGRLRLHVESESLHVELAFSPRLAVQSHGLNFSNTRAIHQWMITELVYDISGTITAGADSFKFQGRGYHEHRWGTGPLFWEVERLFCGRVLRDDSCYAFQLVTWRDRALTDELRVLEADDAGIREIPVSQVLTESPRSLFRPRHLSQMVSDDVLKLHHPRLIDSTRFGAILYYDAICRGRSGATALCHISSPRAPKSLALSGVRRYHTP